MLQSPKKHITKLTLRNGYEGTLQRIENTKEAFEENLVFPKPVEYEDVDRAVLDFVKEKIHLLADGKEAPTFTLFSNQRFSEYSQTWEHVDADGNLLMDFKTVNRNSNPSWGENQGGLYNIPGDRRYTIQMKEVLDDNGTESYEVYSMGQPMSIDLEYTLNYVTADWDKLNDFNLQLNELFKSIQCYIKPNGWYMPIKLDSVDDETEYAVDNRKIYIQSADLLVQAIISPKSSYKIERFPKRNFIGTEFDKNRNKTHVDVEEGEDGDKITISFSSGVDKTQFTFDERLHITDFEKENIRDFSIYIDGEKVSNPYDGVTLTNGSDIKIKINKVEKDLPARLILH